VRTSLELFGGKIVSIEPDEGGSEGAEDKEA
jgi:hypothetical protein